MVTRANDNATYHITELDVTRIAVPGTGKRIKVFKKRYKEEPGLNNEHEGDDPGRTDEGREVSRIEEDG